jgi:hypothetical protein
MINDNTLAFTGQIVKVKGESYYEFAQALPAPDWVRYHYSPQMENPIESQKHFTELKYQPQILQNAINQSMIEKIKKSIASKIEVKN